MLITKCHSCGIPALWRCTSCDRPWCVVCGTPHAIDCGGTLETERED